MGLNDLIPEEKKTSTRSRSKKTSKTNRHGRKVEQSHPEDGFKIGDKDLELRTDMPTVDCSFCGEGMAFLVKGLSRWGGKYRCYRIFCENSIMKHKREPIMEKELVEIRNKMELAVKRRGVV